MFDDFTDRARKVMSLANGHARRLQHAYLGAEHVLLGLVEEGGGIAANVLKNLGIDDLSTLRAEVEKLLTTGPDLSLLHGINQDHLPQTPRTRRVLEHALEEAQGLGHRYVGTEHLLLGLLREKEGLAAVAMRTCGVAAEAARSETLRVLGLPDATTVGIANAKDVLADVAAALADDSLDPVGKLTKIRKVLE